MPFCMALVSVALLITPRPLLAPHHRSASPMRFAQFLTKRRLVLVSAEITSGSYDSKRFVPSVFFNCTTSFLEREKKVRCCGV